MRLLLLVALTLLGTTAHAQDPSLLGTLDFPTSASPEAQAAFEAGMLAAHSFWWDEARDHFRRAQQIDPAFAMAYWGEALTHHWPGPLEGDPAAGDAEGRAVLARLDALPHIRWTDRERAYVNALRFLYAEGSDPVANRAAHAEAMVRLAEQYRADPEAAILAARARMSAGYVRPDVALDGPAFVVPIAADLEEAFDRNPDHPGVAHYLIHLYDTPAFAPMGLRAARVYAEIAPASSHALHMPSHIFRALGMWDEVAASNVAAYEASVAWQERTGRPVTSRDVHALDWLVDAHVQRGRFSEARQVADELRVLEEAAAAEGQPLGFVPMTRDMVENRLFEASRRAGLDVEPRPLPDGFDLRSVPPGPHIIDLGMRAAYAGQDSLALGVVAMLGQFSQIPAVGPFRPVLVSASHAIDAIRLRAAGDLDAALAEAAQSAEAIGDDPLGVERGRFRSVYASLLMESGAAAAARGVYAALVDRYPRVAEFEMGLARAADAVGDGESAAGHYRTVLDLWAGADEGLPALGEAREFVEAR